MPNQLIKILPHTHNVELEIAYASANNFTGNPIYTDNSCYLHSDAEKLLRKAVELTTKLDLKLKIFDAFRPVSAQWTLWNHTPDPNYISHPEHGSIPHCRGVAVDLTLLDINGKELNMGTKFDDLSDKSHHGVLDLSKEVHINRNLLLGIMTSAGWDFYRNEWWHYQLFNSRNYPVIK